MLARAELGGRVAQGAPWIPELPCLERTPAPVALVPPGALEVAVRARPDEVSVGQEAAVLRTEGALVGPAGDESVLQQGEEDLLDGLLVDDRPSRRVAVEGEPEVFECVPVDLVIALGDFRGGLPLLLRRDEDRGSVHVGPGDHEDLVAPQSVEAGEDVGR